jgi:phosphate uptake regulator
MQRKLIKQGGGGYTIYLPKKWVDSKGFKEGDEVDVSEVDTSLVIGSAIKEKKEISVKINEHNKNDIKNILTHLYRKGFVKIIFEGIDVELAKEIKEVTRDLLLGFEITEKTAKSCTVENISEPTEEKFEIMLKKIFFINSETIGVILSDFEKGNFESSSEIDEMKKLQDKLILFCRRLVIRDKYDKNQVLSWELLTFLMHIFHALYYFYDYSRKNKIKKDVNLIRLLKSLQEYFEFYNKAFYQDDIKSIHKINTLKEKYQFGMCLEMIEKAKGKQAVAYSYLKDVFRLIQIGSSPILSKVIGKEINSD